LEPKHIDARTLKYTITSTTTVYLYQIETQTLLKTDLAKKPLGYIGHLDKCPMQRKKTIGRRVLTILCFGRSCRPNGGDTLWRLAVL